MDAVDLIKKRIEELGSTQRSIAKKTGMSDNDVSRCLNKKRRLQADEFIKIAQVLNLEISDFKKEDDLKPTG